MFLNQKSQKIQDGYQCVETITRQENLPNGARFSIQGGFIEITVYAPGLFRIRFNPKSKPDYGLLSMPPTKNLDVRVLETPVGFRIACGELSVELQFSPLRLVFKKGSEKILKSVTDRAFLGNLRWMPFASNGDSWLASFALCSNEPVYGLGEKFSSLNRRGELVESWNEDATNVNSDLSYKNVPFAWSPNGWGIYTHTTSRVTHAVGYPQWSHRSYIINVEDNDLDLFLFIQDDPGDLLNKFTQLTGRTPELPRWSYGVWMSRAYYKTADELISVSKELRKRNIPCDVLVLDGRAWHKQETRFDFEWDSDRYPDPADFVQKLRDDNFRLCLWEYPYVSEKSPLFPVLDEKKFFLLDQDGKSYIHRWLPPPFDKEYPHLQPSGIIDFTNPDAYNWYFKEHKKLFDIGVSVMKTDYGESIPEDVIAHNGDTGKRLHNVYGLLYNQCVYDATAAFSAAGGMVWGRAGWAGSQRYPVQWGGDPQADWEGLAASIRGGLSYGMSGVPFYSHDIGGFSGEKPDPDLYIRWAQAGIMMSHTRFHGAGQREPWHFGRKAEQIVTDWIKWRYRLIPYLQGCALQASQNGIPVMRAMPLAFPDDPLSWSFEEQYMLGPCLLVVPVLNPESKVRFYLPPGGWVDLWNHEFHQGPKLMDQIVPPEHIPVFGRQGTILPLGPIVEHTGELSPGIDLEEIWVFGKPNEGIELPGLKLDVNKERIINLPDGVLVNQWIEDGKFSL